LDTILKATHGSKIESASSTFRVGSSDTIGKRETMEDEMFAKNSLYAVFDGHGGKNAALMCSHILEQIFYESLEESTDITQVFNTCFEKMHQQIVSSRIRSGTTALVAYVDPTSMELWMAHAGDSRAVLCTTDGKAVRLTEDHKPTNVSEKKRVESSGGKVTHRLFSKVYRVNDTLSITRALGDQEYQRYGITHKPQVSGPFNLKEDGMFVILACDGLWDVISDKKACSFVCKEDNPSVQAQMLRDLASKKGSTDNIR
jgi:serine/threonine protein phosphatase PrpC